MVHGLVTSLSRCGVWMFQQVRDGDSKSIGYLGAGLVAAGLALANAIHSNSTYPGFLGEALLRLVRVHKQYPELASVELHILVTSNH